MPSLASWLFSAFIQSLQSAMANLDKISENEEGLHQKMAKMDGFFICLTKS